MSLTEQHIIRHREEQQVEIADWHPRVMHQERELSLDLQNQGLAIIKQWEEAWRQAVPVEETWVRRHFDIPGLIVRIDATVENGRLMPYEVEERPAGLGLASEINPDFATRFREVSSTWPPITSVLSHRRTSTDDSRVRHVVSAAEVDTVHTLLLVRAAGKEDEYHSLSHRSVGTVKEAGNKAYGEKLGWWERVEPTATLPFEKPFVLKPLQGAMGQEVMLWHPAMPSFSAEKQELETALRQSSGRYIQTFHAPMESGIVDLPYMIYRTYFGFNTQTKDWEALGGFWCVSDQPIVDGGQHTLYAPLILEQGQTTMQQEAHSGTIQRYARYHS